MLRKHGRLFFLHNNNSNNNSSINSKKEDFLFPFTFSISLFSTQLNTYLIYQNRIWVLGGYY
jgi:hypothetical protein